MAVQAVAARRLCGTRVHKIVEERFRLILHKGFSASLGRGKPRLARAAFSEEESPVGNWLRAFSNVARESCHDSRRQAVVSGKEQGIGSTFGNGDIESRLQSHVGNAHSPGPTIVQEAANWLLKDNNAEKNTMPTARPRELQRQLF